MADTGWGALAGCAGTAWALRAGDGGETHLMAPDFIVRMPSDRLCSPATAPPTWQSRPGKCRQHSHQGRSGQHTTTAIARAKHRCCLRGGLGPRLRRRAVRLSASLAIAPPGAAVLSHEALGRTAVLGFTERSNRRAAVPALASLLLATCCRRLPIVPGSSPGPPPHTQAPGFVSAHPVHALTSH